MEQLVVRVNRYFLKRILFVFPTLFGVMFINFMIIQVAPGGPIDQIMAQLREDKDFLNQDDNMSKSMPLDEEIVAKLKKEFEFDKPLLVRFFHTVKKYIFFDFGTSYFKGKPVRTLMAEKLPVSISLALWSTFFIFLLGIPIGIFKAVKHGSLFDIATTAFLGITFAIPSFLMALGLLVLLSGGSFFDIFPIRGLVSDHFYSLSFLGKIKDYIWHLTIPITSIVLTGLAKPTILTKNAFLEEIEKSYVLTARAKGAGEWYIIFKHCFRNAVLVLVSSSLHIFLSIFFYTALLIEVLFSLDGIGYLSYEATLNRDYPVIFASLYIFTLMGIGLHILSDFLSSLIDPRINLECDSK